VLGLTSGCYWQNKVAENEVGLHLPDGAKIGRVLGPGKYSESGWYAELKKMDVSAKTVEWSDPDLVTFDKQPISVSISATFARKRDDESVRLMWNKYHSEATNDEALLSQVSKRIPSVAKQVTARYTLDQLIGTSGDELSGRSIVQQQLTDLLAPELEEFGVELLDVRVTNFQPDQAYLDLLKEKSNVSLESEIAVQRTAQLTEQLNQEMAQTEIDLEIAERENLVNEELAQVYDNSDRYYELERLRLLKDVIGENDKIYFVPEGTDITLYLAGQGAIGAPGTTEE
jgi:hypothetical protein